MSRKAEPLAGFDRPRALYRARQAMAATGQWSPGQSMGRRWPIGCVALEITQRCNLDCSACYLSESSERVHDLPLDELFRRIDVILGEFGPGTGIQVTGGDPTLRKPDELIAIVRRVRDREMVPSLFTNGIKATRSLLRRLADAGLEDVVFHVDMTQGRPGYASERELNVLRQEYVDQARGLGLAVFFNTTVFRGNLLEVPDVVAFFVRNSGVVRLASFQPQAATGRGEPGENAAALSTRSVIAQIERGAGASLSFDTAHIGHRSCNRYAMGLVVNGRMYDALDHGALYNRLVAATAGVRFDRRRSRRAVGTFLGCLVRDPRALWLGAPWLVGKLWRMRHDLIAARGKVGKLSFFIHNFMDACSLDKERIAACVFMVATRDGPVSMCAHNARRDDFILSPVKLDRRGTAHLWDPLTGKEAALQTEREEPAQLHVFPK